MRTNCPSAQALCAVALAIAASVAPVSALAEEPTSLPQVPRLELAVPPALLLAQATPPSGGSKPGASAAPPATAAQPPAAPPAASPATPPTPPPAGSAPAPGGAPPTDSRASAGGGPPPGAPRPPYPYPPYPFAYGGIPLSPPTLPYKEGQSIPPNYKLEEHSNSPLVITGLSLFALAYGISLGASTIILSVDSRDGESYAPLLIPVVGPFITMATDEGSEAMATMTLNGITQSAGMLLLVAGILAKEKVLERIEPPVASATPEVLVGPGSASVRWRF